MEQELHMQAAAISHGLLNVMVEDEEYPRHLPMYAADLLAGFARDAHNRPIMTEEQYQAVKDEAMQMSTEARGKVHSKLMHSKTIGGKLRGEESGMVEEYLRNRPAEP